MPFVASFEPLQLSSSLRHPYLGLPRTGLPTVVYRLLMNRSLTTGPSSTGGDTLVRAEFSSSLLRQQDYELCSGVLFISAFSSSAELRQLVVVESHETPS